MKPYQLILLISFCSFEADAQLDSYSNFSLANGSLVWESVFPKTGSADSLKWLVSQNLKLDNAFVILTESSDEIVCTMREKIFLKDGNKYSGRVLFQFKDRKYRVLISTVTTYMGVKAKKMAAAWGVSKEVDAANGKTWESDYLNKDGKIKKGFTKGLDTLNECFLKQFNYEPILEKKW